MGLFKILRAAAVHNNKSAGEGEKKEERGRRRGGSQEHPKLFFQKINCRKMAGGASKLKMPPPLPMVRELKQACIRGMC